MKNTIIVCTTILIFTVFFFSCGISDIPLLQSANVSVIAPGVFKIDHNTANTSDSFTGYNVYYKLYYAYNITTVSSDNSYLTDTTKNPTPGLITGKGFRKLRTVSFNGASFSSFNDDDSEVTLSPRPKSNSQTYYIDLSAGIESYTGAANDGDYISGISNDYGFQALLIDGGNTTFLQRQGNGGAIYPFFDTVNKSYIKTQSDIAAMLDSNFANGNNLIIVIAVIPYGIDFVNVQRIYGDIEVSSPTSFDYTRTP